MTRYLLLLLCLLTTGTTLPLTFLDHGCRRGPIAIAGARPVPACSLDGVPSRLVDVARWLAAPVGRVQPR